MSSGMNAVAYPRLLIEGHLHRFKIDLTTKAFMYVQYGSVV